MAYPKNVMAVDLSHWNEVTSWGALKREGVVGVIHKFSQGGSYRDPTYAGRRITAKAAGLLWGRYHFADSSNVSSQVNNALAGWQRDELIALDWEDCSDGTMSLDQAGEFAMEVFVRTSRWPVLYSGNTLKEAMNSSANVSLMLCKLWLAHYASQPVCPPGWDAPWLWQWSQTGSLEGVNGDVDTDAYDGTAQQLRNEWAGGRPQTPPAEVPPPGPVEMETTTITITAPVGSKITVKTTPGVG